MATTDDSGTVPAAASEPPAPASRAGRNLPMAIGVGLGLGAIIIASLLLWRPGFLIVIGAAAAASVWEMRGTLQRARDIRIAWLPVAIGCVAVTVLAWPWGHTAQIVGLAFATLVVMAWRFPRGQENYLVDVTSSVFVLMYIGGLGSFATLLVAPSDGHLRVLTFLIAVVCSDTGGYIAGVFFGSHPMAPTISPKKSWEGFGGSLVIAMTGGALSLWLLLDHPWWQGVVLGAVLAVVSTVGDLAESLIKRDLGVKDMGNLLPGHGGIMDRLDSMLPSALVAWMLLTLFVPVP
jgi:phosphatidate cytidylyltransferase